MGSYGWRQGRSVADALFEEGHLFGFHEALRLIETMNPQLEPVGEQVDPEREVASIRSAIRFDFAASEVEKIDKDEDGRPVMRVNVMGLAGGSGPLPAWVTELALERASRNDDTLTAFLDLFNHRLLSLLHRARKKSLPTLEARSPDESGVASTLFALLGLGTGHLRGAMHISDRALLPFTGLLAARPRSAVGLEQLLTGYFETPVELVPFVGQWEELDEADVTRIGITGQNQRLGESAVLGRRIFDVETHFLLRIGPLTYEQFLDFLPRAACARSLAPLVRFYIGEEIAFSYRLILRAADVPRSRLDRPEGVRLGWTSWLSTRTSTSNDEQVRLQGRA